MATRGHRKGLTLKRKIDIILDVENHPTKQKKTIADEHEIASSTLSTILASKEKYKRQYFGGEDNAARQKTRCARHEGIEQQLLEWFRHTRSQNVPVTGPFMRVKAEEIAHTLGIAEWKCSDGWLTRFKKRHNIVFKAVCGERESVDEASTDRWVNDVLRPTLGRYRPTDVFNADETGVYWRVLPDKTHAFKGDKCYGGKKSKERITVMVCTNMTGTKKLPLLTIGKFEKPRCFKGIKCLPVKYRANKKAWMDSTLFNDWLLNFDQQMAAENRKVVLVIDNCTAHPKIDRHLKATELLFLPPNATCKLQPCDQGVNQNLKVHFRKLLLTKLLRHTDGGADAADFQITLLDALSDLKLAWDMVTASTIKNCFRKACFTANDETQEDRMTSSDEGEQPSTSSNAPGSSGYPSSGGNTEPLLSRLLKEWNISPSEYFTVDEDIMTSGPKETATCTRQSTSATVTSQDSESDDDDCGEAEETVTREEVLEHVHKTNIYLMQTEGQGDVMKAFYHFRDTLDRHIARLATQTRITQFFSKIGTQRKQESRVKSEDVGGEKFHKEQGQSSADQTQTEGKRQRERTKTDPSQAGVRSEESSGTKNREQKESDPTGHLGENEAKDERQTQGEHRGKEPEVKVHIEVEGKRATGVEESRESGKTKEQTQDKNAGQRQDFEKGQRESGFSEMTEDETKTDKPQELLPKEDLFRILRSELSGAKTVEDIAGIAVRYQEAIESYPVTVRSHMEDVTVDTDAAYWLPDDAPHFLPVRIYGDGNCFARCASMMAYGTQDHYDEMRIRIALELAFHIDMYLDNNFLQLGHHVGDDLSKQYAMYSDQYLDQVLTPAAIKRVLSREIENISQPGSYMGIWQIHALASVFKCKVRSIYPKFGGFTVRRHLHRWVCPRTSAPNEPPLAGPPASPLAVMWSSTLGKQQRPEQWRVNHFVVCVPR